MARYRRVPIIIEAERYSPGMEDGFALDDVGDCPVSRPYIDTPEGRMVISDGDWIITGVMGERYPCKPDVFRMVYEPVDDHGGQ